MIVLFKSSSPIWISRINSRLKKILTSKAFCLGSRKRMELPDVPKVRRELSQGAIIFSSQKILLLLGNNGNTHWTLPQTDTWLGGFEYITPRPLNVGGKLSVFIDFGNASPIELQDKYGDSKWLSEEEFKEDQALLTQDTISILPEAWKYYEMLKSRALYHLLNSESYIYGRGLLGYQIILSTVLRTALKHLAEDNESLATLNKIGFFHRSKLELFTWPSVCCTLSSADFNYHSGEEKTFSPGFRLYDLNSAFDLWNTWRNNPQNLEKPNQWETQVNSSGESMKDRMRELKVPDHYEFYAENSFGAIIGDISMFGHISIVVIDARALCTPTNALGGSQS